MAEPLSVSERLSTVLEQYRGLLRHAIGTTLPRASGLEVDDVVQETSLRLLRAFREQRAIENMPSYLYRVAVSASLDAMRRLSRRREDSFETPCGAEPQGVESGPGLRSRQVPPEARAGQRQTLETVERLMAELGDNRRRAVSLHVRGMTPAEIGSLLGWTETKSRNLVYRGLRELREKLQREGISNDWT